MNFIFLCLLGGEFIYNVVLIFKKGSKLKVIDFNFDEYEMFYCFRLDILFFEDYDVYLKCIFKKRVIFKKIIFLISCY